MDTPDRESDNWRIEGRIRNGVEPLQRVSRTSAHDWRGNRGGRLWESLRVSGSGWGSAVLCAAASPLGVHRCSFYKEFAGAYAILIALPCPSPRGEGAELLHYGVAPRAQTAREACKRKKQENPKGFFCFFRFDRLTAVAAAPS